MGARAASGCFRALALLACLATTAAAQTPVPEVPEIPADQVNFEGRSSVLLGSGARALGMGGAFLARPDDATAASWNPAGLSYLRAPEISLVLGRNHQRRRDPDGGIVQDDFVGTNPDFAAVAYPVQVGPALGAVQLSYQRVFSYTGDRDLQLIGQSTARRFDLHSEGGIDVYALGTGLRLTRQWRVGVTLNRWANGFDQVSTRTAELRTTTNLDLELSAWNTNIGVIFSPAESLNIGAVVKTPFSARASLQRARVDRFAIGGNNTEETRNDASRDDLRIEFPLAMGAGVSWRPISTLTLAADLTRTSWSQGRIRNYFTLRATVPGQARPEAVVYPVLPYPSLNQPDQQDTTQFRTGIEYVILRGRLRWPLRAGWFTDSQYFLDADGNSPRYQGFTAGTGVILGPLLLDAAYMNVSGSYFEDPVAPHRVSTRFERILVSLIYRQAR